MPLLKHAKKKQKQDKRRTAENKAMKVSFRSLVKKAIATPTVESLSEAFSSIDKAVKKNIMHKNKAARMKSSLAKVATGKPTGAATVPAKKAVAKKTGMKSQKKKTTAKSSGKSNPKSTR